MFKMKGVVPPVITPFLENGELDHAGVKTIAGYLKNNVDGYVYHRILWQRGCCFLWKNAGRSLKSP